MINVTRPAEPLSLRNNATRWTNELLRKIEECNTENKKVPESSYNKYNKKDVKKSLERMYKKLCCYCEARLGVVDFPHIEHMKPKKIFPEDTFNWNNLHLACTKCNNFKGDKYDEKFPILDPSQDIPISEHLDYELYWIIPKTKRGKTTEEHVDLNREDLSVVRREILERTLIVIGKVNVDPQNPENGVRRKQLGKKCKGEFGSLIKWAMDRYLK